MARAWDSSPILRVPVRVPEGGTNKTEAWLPTPSASFRIGNQVVEPFPVRVVKGGTSMEVIYEQCKRYFYSPKGLCFSPTWLETKHHSGRWKNYLPVI